MFTLISSTLNDVSFDSTKFQVIHFPILLLHFSVSVIISNQYFYEFIDISFACRCLTIA